MGGTSTYGEDYTHSFMYEGGYEDGQQFERYCVLEFLREQSHGCGGDLSAVIEKIERGEHV